MFRFLIVRDPRRSQLRRSTRSTICPSRAALLDAVTAMFGRSLRFPLALCSAMMCNRSHLSASGRRRVAMSTLSPRASKRCERRALGSPCYSLQQAWQAQQVELHEVVHRSSPLFQTLNGRSPRTTTIQVAGILLATVHPCLAPLSRRHTDTRPAAAPTLAAGLPIA